MLWIKSVPLFHLGSCVFSSLFAKIKFILTFQPVLILCVYQCGYPCVHIQLTFTSVCVCVYLGACL